MSGRNPDPRGYYALLRVSPEASRQEIGRAFRALMRRRHPDVGQLDMDPPDGSDAGAILHAFAVLRDAGTRAEYDASGWGPGVQGSTLNHESGQNDHAGRGGRDIPVRIIRRPEPLVRVLPVRWEPGPLPGTHLRGGH
ncbi:J domain-containing protein [Arthrobacter sp. ok362]|uniref:J domain-containing protein n=1 Tax=Arthrobacter sp. ok362 TaxID=1761745 RepID=UPI00087F41BD|nr:DnaJ domain-containing protein [Arthrobacter sp. ok362]SDK62474.1 DnaJ domain-containing protein [Arthrobacter sp. ok362]